MTTETVFAWQVAITDSDGAEILQWGGIADGEDAAVRKSTTFLHDVSKLLSKAYCKTVDNEFTPIIGDVRITKPGYPMWGLESCRLERAYFRKFDPYENVIQGRPISEKALSSHLDMLIKIDSGFRHSWRQGDEPTLYAKAFAVAHPMRMTIQTDPVRREGGVIIQVASEPVRDALRILAFHKCCAVRTNRIEKRIFRRLDQPTSATVRAGLKVRDHQLRPDEFMPVIDYFRNMGLSALADGLVGQANAKTYLPEEAGR